MKLNELKAAEGRRKVRNGVGRGTSSGNGKPSGRGQKGQKSRSGGGVRLGFEGGQTPLFRRMPKRGFLNVNRKDYAIVNLDTLNRLEDGATVSAETLVAAKIIKDVKSGVKVLGNGELTVKNLKVVKRNTRLGLRIVNQMGLLDMMQPENVQLSMAV